MLLLMFFEPKLFILCDMFVCLCVHVMPIPAGSRQMNLILAYLNEADPKLSPVTVITVGIQAWLLYLVPTPSWVSEDVNDRAPAA